MALLTDRKHAIDNIRRPNKTNKLTAINQEYGQQTYDALISLEKATNHLPMDKQFKKKLGINYGYMKSNDRKTQSTQEELSNLLSFEIEEIKEYKKLYIKETYETEEKHYFVENNTVIDLISILIGGKKEGDDMSYTPSITKEDRKGSMTKFVPSTKLIETTYQRIGETSQVKNLTDAIEKNPKFIGYESHILWWQLRYEFSFNCDFSEGLEYQENLERFKELFDTTLKNIQRTEEDQKREGIKEINECIDRLEKMYIEIQINTRDYKNKEHEREVDLKTIETIMGIPNNAQEYSRQKASSKKRRQR